MGNNQTKDTTLLATGAVAGVATLTSLYLYKKSRTLAEENERLNTDGDYIEYKNKKESLLTPRDGYKQDTRSALDKYFPGSMAGTDAEEQIYKQLQKLGFTAENTLFADCSCPDEINHDDPQEDITSLFSKRWGEVFPLAGLAGLPFTGKTGWGAFTSHVPTPDGNVVIMFAPHVGVDAHGHIGSIHREGIKKISHACGASIGALQALQADLKSGDLPTGSYKDQQMDTIKHLLQPHVGEISKAENEQVALVFKMYDIILQYIEDIIHLDWQTENGKLAIIGGIMINCEGNGTDLFLPLKFEVRHKGKKSSDLFKNAFGNESMISSRKK